jgi:hypothetical protein
MSDTIRLLSRLVSQKPDKLYRKEVEFFINSYHFILLFPFQIYVFFLQLLHHEIEISAGGFFDLNYSLALNVRCHDILIFCSIPPCPRK